MANIQHKNIPEAQLHEPKGASSAASGTVYVSTGTGTGNWQSPVSALGVGVDEGKVLRSTSSNTAEWVYPPEGWGFYLHSGTGQVLNTTASKLIIDGAGAASESSYLPRDIRGTGTELWSTADNKMLPIAEGDFYQVRIDIPVVSETGTVTDITIQLDIGGAATPTTIITEGYEIGGRDTPYIVRSSFPVFSGSTFLANGGQVFVKTNAGTITIGSPQILIERTSGGSFL